ncbi:transcription initiation factor TFIID subunit 4-like [Schistocerca serialis cubense]|uniref:transcription initiation factor TFIID subunit 4-like n=1 Tax=Schistocerca serialis cubense TaxID=2023355 RepID=UPI00214E9630|nr:transcription initiation factor TFIID subunit 4-like [Schistocerca serialis cubense]
MAQACYNTKPPPTKRTAASGQRTAPAVTQLRGIGAGISIGRLAALAQPCVQPRAGLRLHPVLPTAPASPTPPPPGRPPPGAAQFAGRAELFPRRFYSPSSSTACRSKCRVAAIVLPVCVPPPPAPSSASLTPGRPRWPVHGHAVPSPLAFASTGRPGVVWRTHPGLAHRRGSPPPALAAALRTSCGRRLLRPALCSRGTHLALYSAHVAHVVAPRPNGTALPTPLPLPRPPAGSFFHGDSYHLLFGVEDHKSHILFPERSDCL